jgi:hypothetical protein
MTQLFMYTRERNCGDQQLARRCLQEWGVPYTEVNISTDAEAAQELECLIGCQAVPTLIVAAEGRCPIEPPSPINPPRSVRNLDRGAVISEPTSEGLRQFLLKHGLLQPA